MVMVGVPFVRNAREKRTTVHKSKYDVLLDQERRRMVRNSELLQLLENIDDVDGTTTMTRTEQLELLKVSLSPFGKYATRGGRWWRW